MDAHTVLVENGLSEKEATIYLALVSGNRQTALAIARQTKLDRTVTYDTLEKLIAKGIVSMTVVNNAKHFTAISPVEFMRQSKLRYSSLAQVMKQVQNITQKNEGVPCEFFSGKEGVKAMAREFIQTAKEYLVINLNEEFDAAFSYFTDQAIHRLDERKVKERAIIGKGNAPKKLRNGSYRTVEHSFIAPVTTVIEKDIVQFFLWQEPFYGIRIKSNALAKAQRECFELLWATARP